MSHETWEEHITDIYGQHKDSGLCPCKQVHVNMGGQAT